jgi:LPS-assembly lipoprotein
MWFFRITVIAVFAVAAGCGFQPLHAPGGGGDPSVLSKVDVAPIPNRLGQVVRNRLVEQLTPRGSPIAAKYRVVVSLRLSKEALAIGRDDSATRYNVSLEATYDLLLVSSGDTVLQGTVRSVAAYNVVSSDYANVVAERDAKLRAAREVGDEIKLRLAVDLAKNERS